MPDTLTFNAATALRALTEVLERHSELPESTYLTVSLLPGRDTPHADMQFGSVGGRTPRQNIAAVAAWAAALATTVEGNGATATVNGIRLSAYHPSYTAADLDDECTCAKHCTHR